MASPASGICGVRPDVDVVLVMRDEVHLAQVHGLVGGVEADVALFRLASVSRRSDDQTLDVGQDALVLAVGVSAGHDHHLRHQSHTSMTTAVGVYTVNSAVSAARRARTRTSPFARYALEHEHVEWGHVRHVVLS